ncbi:unnamed protein product [Owenia fusiformis]|uniref:C2H2-type domain-containing protein n=1 Tax=Owenia fusiformis TaxID=6347 RepID=A0A8S4N7E0_OWEFU|nr:unnamed protein product [Owenia fusiformis]
MYSEWLTQGSSNMSPNGQRIPPSGQTIPSYGQTIPPVNVPTKRKQTGKRPSCQICLRTFQTNQNLKVHMNIHTGAKPFKCDSCEEAFPHHYSLTLHKKNRHNKNK